MRRSGRPKSSGVLSKPLQTPGMGRTSKRLFAAAILLFIVTRCYIAFVLNPKTTDITLYFDYAARTIDREEKPYCDYAIEYPPVAWWSMAVPRLLDGRRLAQSQPSPTDESIMRDYHQAYRLEMALFDVASFALFLAIVRKRRPQSAGWAALVYVATSTILGYVLYDHLDEGTLLFCMLAAYAWTRTLGSGRSSLPWSWAAFFFLGLGFAHKIVPAIAVPFLLLGEWQASDRWKRMAVALFGLALGMAGPFAIQYAVSGPGVLGLFTHHAGRGIQVESLYSTLMWIGSLFGGSVSISLSHADGSYCVFGDSLPMMKILSTVLVCGFLGVTWIWAAARRSRLGRTEALGLACYALGACAIFSKVFSPQYFVWSIPMLLLAAVEILPEKGKTRWMLAGLLIVVAGLTTWLFPCHYFCASPDPNGTPLSCGLIPASPAESLASSSLAYMVLAMRNVCYLGLVVWMGAMVCKRLGKNGCGIAGSAVGAEGIRVAQPADLSVSTMSRRRKRDRKEDVQPFLATLRQAFSLPWHVWAGIGLLIALTTLVYLPALGGGALLDDDLLLTQNKIVKAPDGLYQFWFTANASDYWPLTNTTFWIEWRLWGEHLMGYHVTNLVLHIVESLLIWFLLRKLHVPGAFFGALLFAVHPVNVESVAWIASRKNLVAMLFFLLSLWCYLNAEERSSEEDNGPAKGNGGQPPGIWTRATAFSADEFSGAWYWMSLAAFVLAMLGKGSVAMTPALLLCILWWKRPLEWRDMRRMLPFFAVGVGLAALNVWFQTHDTEETIRNVAFVDRTLGAGGAVWFYLCKAIWPFDLAPIYPSWNIDAANWVWWIPLCGAAFATGALLVAARPWTSARNRFSPFWFAWVFFGVALFPVMGLCDVGFMKYALVADRYLHLALLGIVALAAAGIGIVCSRGRGNLRWAAIATAALVVVVFSFLSWRQSGLYIDRFTLFQAAKEKNPDCWMIYHTLGTWELNQNRPQASLDYFLKALDLCPHEDIDRAQIHERYGLALFKLGRTREGIEQFESAFAVGKPTPDIIEKLRHAYRETGKIDKLLDFDSRLTTLFPRNPVFHNSFGLTLAQTGRLPEAIEQYRQAIELDPKNAETFNNLGAAYYRRGDIQRAMGCYQQALQCKPDYAEAFNNLGTAYYHRGDIQQAVGCYQRALQCNPDHAETHYNLGGLFYQMNAIPDAISHLEAAVSLKPDYVKAHFLLAKCYKAAHQNDKAIAAGRRALEAAQSKNQDRTAAEIEKWLKSVRDRNDE